MSGKSAILISLTAIDISPCRAIDDGIRLLIVQYFEHVTGIGNIEPTMIARKHDIAVCPAKLRHRAPDHAGSACNEHSQILPASAPYCAR
jgi:hypothetical protein